MLRIQRLCKKYGSFQALDGLDLEVKQGQLYGFVGSNGAGKTTTMKIISGLLKADYGEVWIGGVDALKNTKYLKNSIGYMPDFFGVYDNLKAIEYMEFYASVYHISGKEARKLCLELMDLVNLSDKADSYVDGLSRGMKQRLCLARSLVHNPSLLLLDEPASGLDPKARYDMKEILRNLSDMGKTILISSHILTELTQMCTHIGIIQTGRMLRSGSVDQVMTELDGSRQLEITLVQPDERAVLLLKEHPSAGNIEVKENKISLDFTADPVEEQKLLKLLVEGDIPVRGFKRLEGSLESVFLELIDGGGAKI